LPVEESQQFTVLRQGEIRITRENRRKKSFTGGSLNGAYAGAPKLKINLTCASSFTAYTLRPPASI
jgi:hypothetical protein